MKNLTKKALLSIAFFSAMTLVGCSSDSDNSLTNRAIDARLAETMAIKVAVAPALDNKKDILVAPAPAAGSARAKLDDKINITLPEGFSDSNDIETAVNGSADLEKKKLKNDSEATFKTGTNGANNVASYKKDVTFYFEPVSTEKVDTYIIADGSIISGVSYYGNKYTVVFATEDVAGTDKDGKEMTTTNIKGSVFSGKQANVNLDTTANRIAQFTGTGKDTFDKKKNKPADGTIDSATITCVTTSGFECKFGALSTNNDYNY